MGLSFAGGVLSTQALLYDSIIVLIEQSCCGNDIWNCAHGRRDKLDFEGWLRTFRKHGIQCVMLSICSEH